ncbi:MAG: divergent PAP2 family protein [Gammaproteobacteria bacterium]|nr:divergent PAP2 family protein [Gammaproteobacteria bacterium]
MLEILHSKPFLVALGAGAVAQIIKVLSFIFIEKKVNYKRIVQADGSPNTHMAVMAALGISVGLKDGFDSAAFVLALCINIIVCVDTLNVKNATSKQGEMIQLLVERLRRKKAENHLKQRDKSLSYRPIDLFSGAALGIAFAFIVL